ncbi:ABC transporter substrate-binding protein [Clostridia bacterium]|nr:ABC transporter substrate-binding protein [Clostridia bacterium]
MNTRVGRMGLLLSAILMILVPLTARAAEFHYIFDTAGSGEYQIALEYAPLVGYGADIQLSVAADGGEQHSTVLPRVWQAESAQDAVLAQPRQWEKDVHGNDLLPRMSEDLSERTVILVNSQELGAEPIVLNLNAGRHELLLVNPRGDIDLRGISLVKPVVPLPYVQTLESWNTLGFRDAQNVIVSIQAEDALRVSASQLSPVQDQSSPAVSPVSATQLFNNSIGGYVWDLPGQWIEWAFDVPVSGFYHIALNVKQSFTRGSTVSRTISIDGAVPFAEFQAYAFAYKQSWRLQPLADELGTPYDIYLEAGRHTLRMEATLGEISEILDIVKDTVKKLNSAYRSVTRLTGVDPDEYQDYQIGRRLPNLNGDLMVARDALNEVIAQLRTMAGGFGERERSLVSMRDQLNRIIADTERFAQEVPSFRANIRGCAAWLNEAVSQPLQLDEIILYSPDETPLAPSGGFLSSMLFELNRMIASFTVDYNSIGNTPGAEASSGAKLTLWGGFGRDQARILKRLIDNDFTPVTGISVELMVVDLNTLMQATLAGQGPDVVVQLGGNSQGGPQTGGMQYGMRYPGQSAQQDQPLNYGLRNAAIDLSRFADLEEVLARFHASAVTPYRFGDAVYALPETQSFPMMFYRKDILGELGIDPPDTWPEVVAAMRVLSQNQMTLGMMPNESTFAMLLFQNGGAYYDESLSRSALNTYESLKAFQIYCEFFTDYRLDKATSVEERFRTGESPIVITDYSMFSNLSVSAPELAGSWSFAPVPGTAQADGSISRAAAGSGSACVIMSAAEDPDAAWTFLKWWTDTPTQSAYDLALESLMGVSARIPTANLETFERLPWQPEVADMLRTQRDQVLGIPQAPGGYMSFRGVNNAFFSATTQRAKPFFQAVADAARGVQGLTLADPREALVDQVRFINEEITYKREEFGLPTGEHP